MILPSGGDDTAAIQTAIDTSGVAELAPGDFNVSALNLTGRDGAAIIGRGYKTRLIPASAVPAVIDCTGSTNVLLRDFRLFGNNGSPVVPSLGILAAQKQGSAASDVLKIEGVRVDGFFSLASLFVLQVQSSRIDGSQFYNYQPGAITAVFTANNFFGATSAFQTINNANDMQPSDWTVTACEFHNFGVGWALWLGAIESFRMYGGNISSQHVPVSVNGCAVNGSQKPSANVIFDGTTFYSDSGVQPSNAVSGMTSACTFRNNYHSMPLP